MFARGGINRRSYWRKSRQLRKKWISCTVVVPGAERDQFGSILRPPTPPPPPVKARPFERAHASAFRGPPLFFFISSRWSAPQIELREGRSAARTHLFITFIYTCSGRASVTREFYAVDDGFGGASVLYLFRPRAGPAEFSRATPRDICIHRVGVRASATHNFICLHATRMQMRDEGGTDEYLCRYPDAFAARELQNHRGGPLTPEDRFNIGEIIALIFHRPGVSFSLPPPLPRPPSFFASSPRRIRREFYFQTFSLYRCILRYAAGGDGCDCNFTRVRASSGCKIWMHYLCIKCTVCISHMNNGIAFTRDDTGLM